MQPQRLACFTCEWIDADSCWSKSESLWQLSGWCYDFRDQSSSSFIIPPTAVPLVSENVQMNNLLSPEKAKKQVGPRNFERIFCFDKSLLHKKGLNLGTNKICRKGRMLKLFVIEDLALTLPHANTGGYDSFCISTFFGSRKFYSVWFHPRPSK